MAQNKFFRLKNAFRLKILFLLTNALRLKNAFSTQNLITLLEIHRKSEDVTLYFNSKSYFLSKLCIKFSLNFQIFELRRFQLNLIENFQVLENFSKDFSTLYQILNILWKNNVSCSTGS